jgi:uncharacterized membrane protein YfcA
MADSVWLYSALFVTAAAAGWIDSIAGGGGLVTIPVLLGVGLPPQLALGTNKFQASFGSFTAALYHVRKQTVVLKDARPGIMITLLGSAVGTWAVQQIQPGVLNIIIPFLLLSIALYMLIGPIPSDADRTARIPRILFYCLTGLLFGFYDGFFGPGVGSFWAIAFVFGLGFHLTKATAYTKVMNFTSNAVSFLLFLIGGHVLFTAGLVMAVGQILGARLGSGLVLKRGARFIRPILVTVVIATTLKLMYDRLF